VDDLPPRQGALLRALVEAVEPDPRFRALELQCSLARGAGDELSDLDLGLWLADADAAAAVPGILRGLASLVDLLETSLDGEAYFFGEYDNGVQIDLWAPRANRAKGRAPGAVVLFDKDGLLAEPYEPPAYRASADDVRSWSFHAWVGLSNLDKYLRRGSPWEAHSALEEARSHLHRLHAAKLGIPYPAFGLTALLDEPEPSLPLRIEKTVATLDADDLRRAGRALAELLEAYETPALAAAVRARL
jgi:hypothetical protein